MEVHDRNRRLVGMNRRKPHVGRLVSRQTNLKLKQETVPGYQLQDVI